VSPEQPVFYYDLGSPLCYLAAERIMGELPVVPEWEPVLGASLGIDVGDTDRDAVEHAAAEFGTQPLRWPSIWPPETRAAMLAASYAKQIGRAVAFSLAAFRQAFAGGRDLSDLDTVLIAAAACEMHPTAVLRALEMRSVAESLDRASARALSNGISSLPAIQVGERVFSGAAAVSAAAGALQGVA
jgi:2-hydroxychromene-2-carboxylate isomerase